ncbi:hypothetical protein [Streptomyces griseoaurantiacus]|uniref:hypothetical protein n=1 Tax=Streptomyces griseoaurantiacus TaxID=68213 RepID=UPI00345F99D0
MGQLTTTTSKTTIPPMDPGTNGHEPFIVQAADATRERADQLARESADRYIAKNMPAVAALLNEEPTGCTVWPGLCTKTGDHDEHNNFTHGYERTGWPVSVGFVETEDGQPVLYVDNGLTSDFPPEHAPTVAQHLRDAADYLEGMQAKVETGRALARLRKVRETADTAFAQVLTIMETAVVRDGADPAEVGERVLELLAQVRAQAGA